MWIFAPLVIAGVYLAFRGFFIEPAALRLEQVTVPLEDLPAGLDGLRILHATDLHLRSDAAYEARLVELVRQAQPDFIAITGDCVDSTRHLPALERLLGELKGISPVYAVLGDNDMAGHQQVSTLEVQAALERGGARVLRNTGVYITGKQGALLFLAGIDDPQAGRPLCLADALAKRPTGVITVLLTHSAEPYQAAQDAGVDLLLAGHTHGGQVCLPWRAIYTNDRLGPRFASGLLRHGNMQMHVGRGVGWAKLRVRLFCPPEVTLLRLSL